MSSADKIEGCFTCLLEKEVLSSFTSPVVLHWGLGCRGDISGCLSWGGRCAAGVSREGVGTLDSLQYTGCPPPEDWPDPLRSPAAGGAWGCCWLCAHMRGERRADRAAGQL